MIERPSRRELTRPAPARTFRLVERVLARLPVARAISPAARPAGPARTSRRKTSRRPGWARAERAPTAACGSIGSAAGRDAGRRHGSVFAIGDGLAEGEERLPAHTGRI